MPLRGYVFDAYGTLFDVHSIVEVGREITVDPQSLSATWRQKQLEYTWLRALMGQYEDFWTVTEGCPALRDPSSCPHGERSTDPAADGRIPIPGVLPRGEGRAGSIGAATARHSFQWLAAHAGGGRGLEWARRPPRPRALGRCREDLQAFAAGLRTRAASPGRRSEGAALRVVERMGRGGRQGVRVPGRLVQPDPGTRGGTWCPRRLHDQPPRSQAAERAAVERRNDHDEDDELSPRSSRCAVMRHLERDPERPGSQERIRNLHVLEIVRLE